MKPTDCHFHLINKIPIHRIFTSVHLSFVSLTRPTMVAAKMHDVDRTLIFTYGTLKRGFSNHNLVQDLISTGDAVFVGDYTTSEKYPLVCGPYRVPFLLNLPGKGDRVKGELYAVSRKGLERMDELEGTSRGHYERRRIEVEGVACAEKAVEAYYAHGCYAMGLWKRNGERGYGDYTEKVAIGYVRRSERPKDTSFLDQIRAFVSSASD